MVELADTEVTRMTEIPVSTFHIMAATTLKASLPTDAGRSLVETPD